MRSRNLATLAVSQSHLRVQYDADDDDVKWLMTLETIWLLATILC